MLALYRSWLVLFAVTLIGCSNEKRLRAACEGGDPGACDVLSARYAVGDGVRQDPALAFELGGRAAELCSREDAGPSPTCARYPRIKSVPLDMPRMAASGDIQIVFAVVLTADGKTLVDSKEVSGDDAVLALAKSAREKNADVRAVIKADTAVPHGRVIHVLDLLKQAQMQKIAFGVSPL
jgi:TPR repeat protein